MACFEQADFSAPCSSLDGYGDQAMNSEVCFFEILVTTTSCSGQATNFFLALLWLEQV